MNYREFAKKDAEESLADLRKKKDALLKEREECEVKKHFFQTMTSRYSSVSDNVAKKGAVVVERLREKVTNANTRISEIDKALVPVEDLIIFYEALSDEAESWS